MKAIQQQGYGDPRHVLHQVEQPMPTISDDHVLVRVVASSANPADWHLACGEPLIMRPALGGLRAPRRIAGADFAGVIEDTGSAVTHVSTGDEVYGYAHGAFAEYVSAPAAVTARKPATLAFLEAAALPLAGMTALQSLRHGGLAPGQRVLILGASGGVGTLAVQLAAHAGAHVTGVCGTDALDLVRSLGADHVIDYTVQNPSNGDGSYDLILQLGGRYSPSQLRRALTPRGTLVQSMGDGNRWFGPLGAMAGAALLNVFVRQRLTTFMSKEATQVLDELRELIDDGHLRPVIDSTFPLEQAGSALARVKEGHPRGKVAIAVES